MAVVVLVAVDTADEQRLAVEEQAAVTDLDGAEPDAAGRRVGAVIQHEGVEPGLFGRPEARRANAGLEALREPLGEDDTAAEGRAAWPRPRRARRPRPSARRRRRRGRTRPGSTPPQTPSRAREMPACHHWSWSSTKLASDQRTTTATSSFRPPRRTRSVTSNSAGVRESFAIPTGCPFSIDVERPLGAAEAEHDPPSGPAARDRERAPVDAGGILLGDVTAAAPERHHHVRVLRDVVAEHRPEARQREPCPTRGARPSARGASSGRSDEPELPVAVERPLERSRCARGSHAAGADSGS